MKTYVLILIHIAVAVVLILESCSSGSTNKRDLKGEWRSGDGQTSLKITNKQFIMNGDSPRPEDYFTKGDTIFTSFEGNQPYSKFVIVKLDEHQLKLMYPDSSVIEFAR